MLDLGHLHRSEVVNGPRTDPCGTPHAIFSKEVLLLLYAMNCLQSSRKLSSNFKLTPLTPYFFNLEIKILLSTVSKVSEGSIKLPKVN